MNCIPSVHLHVQFAVAEIKLTLCAVFNWGLFSYHTYLFSPVKVFANYYEIHSGKGVLFSWFQKVKSAIILFSAHSV